MGAMHVRLTNTVRPDGQGRGQVLPRLVRLALCFALVAVLAVAGCESKTYARTIRITSEPVNVTGLFARVEYLRDGEIVNSVDLIDGNGDGIIDGKSGPKEDGNWPEGWQWFDSMYRDAAVGQTIIAFDGRKVTVTDANTYEFMVGEYECGVAR
jgi:hypothetical protein